MRRSVYLAATATAVLLLLIPAPAIAQESQCDPATQPAATVMKGANRFGDAAPLPMNAIAGRQMTVSIVVDDASQVRNEGLLIRDATGTVLANVNGPVPVVIRHMPLGAMTIEASWDEDNVSTDTCHRVVTNQVEGIPGETPAVKIQKSSGGIDFSVQQAFTGACRLYVGVLPVVVEIRSATGMGRSTAKEPCGKWQGGGIAAGWALTVDPHRYFINFEPRWKTEGVRKLTLRVTAGGHQLAHRRFQVRTTVEVRHRTRYWDGSEAYSNYCLRNYREIFSSGGRLYCDRPGKVTRTYKLRYL